MRQDKDKQGKQAICNLWRAKNPLMILKRILWIREVVEAHKQPYPYEYKSERGWYQRLGQPKTMKDNLKFLT